MGLRFLLVTLFVAVASTAADQTAPLAFSRAARAAIGSRIDAVARASGMSAAKLDWLLATDKDLAYAVHTGNLVYACSGLSLPENDVVVVAAASAAAAAGASQGTGSGGASGRLQGEGAHGGHAHRHHHRHLLGGVAAGGGPGAAEGDGIGGGGAPFLPPAEAPLPWMRGGGGGGGGGGQDARAPAAGNGSSGGGGGGGGGGGNSSTGGTSGSAGQAGGSATAGASSAGPGAPDPVDPSLALTLHSRPGAPKRILLDFDGHVTQGTAWNSQRGLPVITTPPYSVDDDPELSEGERRNIITMWRLVAEDFAPWDVDVTTEDDGRPLEGWGVRAVIGGSSQATFGDGNYGGLAYVWSFGMTRFDPAFIFPLNLGSHPKYVAEAASHEVGHRLGLHHDGPGYYPGHGNWAPIMGVGYGKQVVQWSKGDYVGATQQEDDLAVISKWLDYRPDDHGNSSAAATRLAAAPLAANRGRVTDSVVGNIQNTDDQDWFAFNASAGLLAMRIDLVPDGEASGWPDLVRSDADVSARLLWAANGSVVAEWDPRCAPACGDGATSLLRGYLTARLPADGDYNLVITGVGDGGASDGYTSYASLGEYRVTLAFPAPGGRGSSDARFDPIQPPAPAEPPAPPAPSPAPDPIGPASLELQVKLDTFKLSTSKSGGGRVSKALLLVTNRLGAPVQGAAVSYTWSHVPDGGGAPSFSPVSGAGATLSSSNPWRSGTLALRSPKAAGPRLRLTVTAVTAQAAGAEQAYVWNRDMSDVVKDFTW